MSDYKDQNHVFPEPDMDNKKSSYRPMLADDDSVLQNLSKNDTKQVINSNISFKGVIKDISNTNLEALVKIKNEDHEETKEDPKIVNNNYSENVKENVKEKKVISFEPKLSFWKTKFGGFLKKFWWLLTLLTILLITGIFLAIMSYLDNNKPVPIVKNVELSISGPPTAPKGSNKIWTVTVANNDSVNLKELVLNLTYDREFKVNKISGDLSKTKESDNLFKMNELKVGEKRILNIEGKLEAKIDIATEMKANLKFLVKDFDNSKQKLQERESKYETKVEKSVIRLDITSDSRVPKESDQTIKVDFTNQSGKPLNNFKLKMTYPPVGTNFVFLNSEFFLPGRTKQTTPTVGDHTWNVSTLEDGQTGTLIVNSKMKGQSGDKLLIVAELINIEDETNLNKIDKEVVVVDKALTLKPTLEINSDYIQPGNEATYKILLRNNYNSELNNVKILAEFIDNADLVDSEGINSSQNNPIINKNKKEVQYTGAGVQNLQRMGPKSEVLLEFSFKFKGLTSYTNSTYSQENFYVRPKITVTGDNFEPQSEEGDTYRAKGGPDIEQTVENFTEGNKKIARITWEVKNKFSTLKDVVLRTKTPLPASAWNQSSITPPAKSSQVNYTKENGEIIWKIGDIKPYMGYNGQELKLSFSITNDTDSQVNFIETPTFTAVDTLNTGYEFNQINTPIKGGNPVQYNR
jgi:hypothetical protein